MRQLFISDLHLQQARPDLNAACQYFLRKLAAGADELYLLGDLFEYWIGDDAPLNGMEPITAAFRQLSDAGTRLFFLPGNRDFLVGKDYLGSIGATLLNDPTVISLDGRRTLLMHGDSLCTEDVDYLALRKQLHDPNWQAQFLDQPIEKRLQMAANLRNKSKEAGAEKAYSITDVNIDAVRQHLVKYNADLLIHGHTHRPAVHFKQSNDEEGERVVLGDWGRFGWYAEHCGNGNVKLKRFYLT